MTTRLHSTAGAQSAYVFKDQAGQINLTPKRIRAFEHRKTVITVHVLYCNTVTGTVVSAHHLVLEWHGVIVSQVQMHLKAHL